MHKQNMIEAAKAFGIGSILGGCGNGHINDTVLTDNGTRYVLQRINTDVFKDPVGMMHNIIKVTEHLQKKIILAGGDPARETLQFICGKDGLPFQWVNGDFFRAYKFVDDSVCYEMVTSKKDAESAGRAFGHFQTMLSDFPASELVESIPHFHDTPDRFQKFLSACQRDAQGRLKTCQAEVNFVLAHEADTHVVTDAIQEGSVPLRVTHNDTKINNILFDGKTGKSLCVIDLDTVMPGSLLYDFGDSIRIGAATAAEDEQDLSKVGFSLPLYRGFLEGFTEEILPCMTEKEKELLPFSARLLSLECGMRFLTDYLEGDTYFRTSRSGQNLDRARTQFKMVSEMEKEEEAMQL